MLRLGDEVDGAHEAAHRRLRVALEIEQVAHLHDPLDVVEVLSVDGNPAVLGLAHQAAQRRDRRGRGDRHDVRARGHDLARDRLREAVESVHQPLLVGLLHGGRGDLWHRPLLPLLGQGLRQQPRDDGRQRLCPQVERRQEPQEGGLRVLSHEDVRHAQAEEEQVRHHDAEGGQHRPVVHEAEGERRDDDGHAHVRGVGAEVDGHEHPRRVVEVAVGELDPGLVVEADLGQTAALQLVEGRLDRGQEDGEPGEEHDEGDLKADHARPRSRFRSRLSSRSMVPPSAS